MNTNKTNIAIAGTGLIFGGFILNKLYNRFRSEPSLDKLEEAEETEEELYEELAMMIDEYESKYKTKLIIVTDFDIFYEKRHHILYQKRGILPIMDIDDYECFLDELLKIKTNRMDVMIQSAGGSIMSSNSMVQGLLNLPDKIVLHTHITTYAYSAGCALALCGHVIHVTNHTQFSPVDPQLNFRYKYGDDSYSAKNIIDGLSGSTIMQDISKIQYQKAICYDKAGKDLLEKVLASRSRRMEDFDKLVKGDIPHNEVFHKNELNISFNKLPDELLSIHFVISAIRNNSWNFHDGKEEDHHELDH